MNAGVVGEGDAAASAVLESMWDARYAATDRLWSGHVNPQLPLELEGVPAGAALDAGCGEGGDAFWLAEREWQVTGLDLSTVAVTRAGEEAARRGLSHRTTFEQRDLSQWNPPASTFDLVSAQYLHVLAEARSAIYTGLARAVRPGGTLLMVLHDRRDLMAGVAHPPAFSILDEHELRAVAAGFSDVRVEVRARVVSGVDGAPAVAHDLVLRATR